MPCCAVPCCASKRFPVSLFPPLLLLLLLLLLMLLMLLLLMLMLRCLEVHMATLRVFYDKWVIAAAGDDDAEDADLTDEEKMCVA